MAPTTDRWWYALVQASPLPEAGERVNVAVLLGNGAPRTITFVDGVPRLEGIAGGTERKLFVRVLEDADRRIQAGIELDALRTQLGPQLLVGEPRQLFREPDRRLVDLLRRRYLLPPGPDEDPAAVTPERRAAGTQIDKLMGGLIPALAPKPLRKVTPERLYPERAGRIFKGRVPALSRALLAPKHDILIDGVVFSPERVDETVKVATVRIDRAFWHYHRARADVKRETGRRLLTIGLLMDGSHGVKDQTVADARLYVREAWQRHADHVVDARERTDMRALQDQIAGLISG